MKQRYGLFKVVFNVLVVGLLLGCSFVSSLVSKPTYEPLPPAPTWMGGEITPVSVPTALPSPTAVGKSTLDEISVDYVYTAEMITVIFPLYGSVLDDFVIVTIQNSGSQTARLLVESEIQGYTDKAIDTVDVAAGDTLEVRQNPLLETESIDQLNAQKPASFHLRVALLQNGEEKTILDETGVTTLFARRDYPWKIEGFTQHENFELLTSMVTPQRPGGGGSNPHRCGVYRHGDNVERLWWGRRGFGGQSLGPAPGALAGRGQGLRPDLHQHDGQLRSR